MPDATDAASAEPVASKRISLTWVSLKTREKEKKGGVLYQDHLKNRPTNDHAWTAWLSFSPKRADPPTKRATAVLPIKDGLHCVLSMI
jgi:hypothetical protein